MASKLPFAGGNSRTETKRFSIVVGKRKEDEDPREKGQVNTKGRSKFSRKQPKPLCCASISRSRIVIYAYRVGAWWDDLLL